MVLTPVSWKTLFAAVSSPSAREIKVRVLLRHGHPLLVLPLRQRVAPAAALALYPAQTPLARLVKALWQMTLRWGFAPGSRLDAFYCDPADPFVEFLASLAGTSGLPPFALLAGNPLAPGRRFLVLIFDAAGRAVAVVKAGADAAGVALVEKEAAFLSKAAERTRLLACTGGGRVGADKIVRTPAVCMGIPALRGQMAAGAVHAFATEFIPGASPLPHQVGGIVPILNSWLDVERKVSPGQVPAWQRLVQACAGDQQFAALVRSLKDLAVCPAVFHGDFAPWNIKISPGDGSWTVLDWERGEWVGLPAFDWFHYVLQPAALVRKETPSALVRIAEGLLDSPAFAQYVTDAGLRGVERQWLLAYLFYCRNVLCPAEGSPRLAALLELWAKQAMGS